VKRPSQPSHQLPLALGGSDFPAPVRTTARANKARHRLPVLQPDLIADKGFASTATAGVPRTRADCPVERPCKYVRCRYNLLMEDAETRAGRPGLSHVPRDARGLTLPTQGSAGAERPGTTLRPAWLKVRGLEIEREVRVSIWVSDTSIELTETRNSMLDYWLSRLHIGEPVLVFDDDTGTMVAKARLELRGLVLDRALPESTFLAVLTRVRGVSSCTLDEIDRRGRHTNEQAGDCIGRHRTLAARVLGKATATATRKAREMGMTREELMEGLRGLSASS
jgi:hypothetical protein